MKKHHWYYVFLLLVFAVGIITISLFGYNKPLQMGILIFLAICYIGFGVIHHSVHHTITAKIVIEYIAIATLGISILLFVLQGI